MSLSSQLAARYRARSVRVLSGGEEIAAEGEGGGLAAAVEALGLGPLSGALYASPAVRRITLEDEGVSLIAARSGSSATLTVRWDSGERFEEPLPLEPWAEELGAPERGAGAPERGAGAPERGAGGSASGAGVGASAALEAAVRDLSRPVSVQRGGAPAVALPADPALGHPGFRRDFGLRACYVAGAMAGGISSPALVRAMARGGYLAFYGAGGLPLEEVEAALVEIGLSAGGRPWGANLLHNPAEPAVEERTVDLFLRRGCRFVSASAYMGLSPAVLRYRTAGIRRRPDGGVEVPNRVFAKVSRPEVAAHFLKPAPAEALRALVAAGALSEEQARMAEGLPVADAVTCEADSAGHTDRRALPVILPLIRDLRDRICAERGYDRPVYIGAAGGLGTPAALLAAFALGADYALTGSINQASPEAGTSAEAKALLAAAGMADVASGPAPDMFELGASVQVLSRGSLYAQRARRLYETWRAYGDWSEVPERDRSRIERQILRRSFEAVWADCEDYWGRRDPEKLARARDDGRQRMALVFRWYLGMTSRWARLGESSRKRDFQIWCGPAMGAFNAWAAGGPLEPLEARGVAAMAEALLRGAAVLSRVQALRACGLALPASAAGWDRPAG